MQSTRFKLVQSKSYLLRSTAAQSTPLLSGYDFEKFYFTWIPILAAALATIGLRQMPRPSSPPAWWCGMKRKVSSEVEAMPGLLVTLETCNDLSMWDPHM